MTMTSQCPIRPEVPDTLVCTPDEFIAADYPERRKLVLAQIDATPELWNQRQWGYRTGCGTAFCVAGWAIVLAGLMGVMKMHRVVDEDLGTECVYVTELTANGRRVPVIAAELLGVKGDLARQEMFGANQTYDEVRSALLNET